MPDVQVQVGLLADAILGAVGEVLGADSSAAVDRYGVAELAEEQALGAVERQEHVFSSAVVGSHEVPVIVSRRSRTAYRFRYA